MISERLLQFIWQFQYFNNSEIHTTGGEKIQIIFQGHLNANQGPDFADAKIKIGDTLWVGTIELHIHTSDWIKHKHQSDKNYKNVILHVVWLDDSHKMIQGQSGKQSLEAPVMEMKDRVAGMLLQRYDAMMRKPSFIPCEKMIRQVPGIVISGWKERLLAERLLRKTELALARLEKNSLHWEETFWWMLCRNFGAKVNAETFESIARSIPLNILARHKNQIHQVEAILLGQAGLLETEFSDDYPRMLQKEYRFLRIKYGLKPIHSPVMFLRMRPGNFPTVRLAQLSMLVHDSTHLFSKIKEAASVKDVEDWFKITANDYWHYHYKFDDESNFRKKSIGKPMIDNIIINTIAPVLFAYGHYHSNQHYKDKALHWLEKIAAEKNFITRGFQQLGFENKNAADSQALIELKNEYCTEKRCLECAIGTSILKN
jgi:hypothetical protein